jgi:hypothetical protein
MREKDGLIWDCRSETGNKVLKTLQFIANLAFFIYLQNWRAFFRK